MTHLTHSEAVLLVNDEPDSARARWMHVLGCRPCGDVVRRLLAVPLTPWAGREAPLPAPRPAPDYRQMWARLEARWARLLPQIAAEREEAREVLPALLALPPEERLAAARPTPALAMQLLDESYAAADFDPAEAEELARLAIVVVTRLDRGRHLLSLLAEISAHALTLLGNARRLAGDFAGADQAFREAQVPLAMTIDPLTPATFCLLLAPLRQQQERPEEAAALRQRAAALFAAVGQEPEPIPPAGGTELPAQTPQGEEP